MCHILEARTSTHFRVVITTVFPYVYPTPAGEDLDNTMLLHLR